ncbi:hypothetical protein [Tautonia rosea]|uniref:hypothetical protein n=1 Tax=Tautonia rosea TaxID=2728037 RepID=UPI0014738423|nr:hypothetical protein [Tautonia rosea]
MDRIFLGSAFLHAMLLLAAFGSGLFGGVAEGSWQGLHDRLGPAATMTGVLVNTLVIASIGSREAWIRRVERDAGLPGRFHSRAIRNRRRVAPLAVGSLGLLAMASWLGFQTGSSSPGSPWSLAHLGLASVAIGYQGASLAVFTLAILGQKAMTRALTAEVDRLRPPPLISTDPDPAAPPSVAPPADRLPTV